MLTILILAILLVLLFGIGGAIVFSVKFLFVLLLLILLFALLARA